MDDLRTLLDQLEEREFDYVVERSSTTKDKPAYEAAGYARSTWYDVPEDHRGYLTGLALRLKRRRTLKALMVLDDNAEKAALALVGALDSDNESIRVNAAKEVLDRTTGKPAQRVQSEISGKDGGPIEVQQRHDDEQFDRAISSLADTLGAILPGSGGEAG